MSPPQHNNNPGFKVVKYDAVTKELMDFTTYYTTPSATSWGNNKYTFSQSFNCPPGTSIYNLVSNLQLNEVSNYMNSTFMVKNGLPTFNITTGIEVKPE